MNIQPPPDMSLPPLITYVSVAYTTATEAPNVSRIQITITTTVLPSPLGMFSTLSSSATTAATLPEIDTTCSTTTSPTTLSTSFITSDPMSSGVRSGAILSTSPSSTSNPTSIAVPDSATRVVATASSSPAALTVQPSRPSMGLSGTIGLSTALGILFAAIIALLCYYCRRRRFHKEAMLVAPRLTKNAKQRSIETGEDTLIESNLRGDDLQKDAHIRNLNSQSYSWPVGRNMSGGSSVHPYNTYVSHRSCLTPSSTRPREVSSQEMTRQRSLGSNIYGIRYNTGGILTAEYGTAEKAHHENGGVPPRWDEALERLNSIHAATTLHRELSPPPLRIVKQGTPNPGDQFRPDHSPVESISELDISDTAVERDIQRARAAALAKLEGRLDPYATESVYSRMPDGVSLRALGDVEGRPWWRHPERHWPD